MWACSLLLAATVTGAGCQQTNGLYATSGSAFDAAQTTAATAVSVAASTVSNVAPVVAAPVVTVPESGFEDVEGVVTVSVYLDLKTERIRFPEGTAMLRAMRLLRKARPEIPSKYVVRGRVLLNSHNRTTGLYTYVVEYDPASIAAVIAKAKDVASRTNAPSVGLAAQEQVVAKPVADSPVATNMPPSMSAAPKRVAAKPVVDSPITRVSPARATPPRRVAPNPLGERPSKEDIRSQSFLLEEEE